MKKYLALLLSIMMMFQTVLPLNTTWAAAETATATDVAPAVTEGEAAKPTETPTVAPTAEPTAELTEGPTAEPTEKPVEETETPPTESPAEATAAATDTEPVTTPAAEPTEKPVTEPTTVPETKPTENPTEVPTEVPTAEPTEAPTKVPTAAPTATPAPAPLQVALNADATFTYAHTQVNFNMTIAGGVAPFVIDWKVTGNGSQQDQGQATDVNEASYYIAYTPSTFGSYTVQATVTDANGTQTTVSAELIAAEHEGETEATWRESVASVTREYDWRADLVAIAQTQVGYAQSEKDFVVDANGDRHAYSRYGAWYGDEYADDWSTMFIAFCMKYAGIPEEDFPRDDSIKVIKKDLNAKGVLETSDEYAPSRGDVVFFKSGDAKIGIVSKVSDTKMDVIYASADGKVKKDEWEIRSRQIDCFANMEKLMIRAGKLEPTAAPTAEATPEATEAVTAEPTVEVTTAPTAEVTPEATEAVTAEPTAEVTAAPTAEVTPEATEAVTAEPTVEVTTAPTAEATPEATEAVTAEPTAEVTAAPTAEATPEATEAVTTEPTAEVMTAPTAEVTPEATEAVTAEPTAEVTEAPTAEVTPGATEAPIEPATASDLEEAPTAAPEQANSATPSDLEEAPTAAPEQANPATPSDLEEGTQGPAMPDEGEQEQPDEMEMTSVGAIAVADLLPASPFSMFRMFSLMALDARSGTDVDFSDYLTGSSIQYKKDNAWKDYTSGTLIERNTDIRFKLNYLLPPNTLNGSNTIYYDMSEPDHAPEIKLFKPESGKVRNSFGVVVGSYTISEDGYIKITFNDDYVTKNTDQSISGSIWAECNTENIETKDEKVDISFIDGVNVEISIPDPLPPDNSDATVKKTVMSVNKETGEIEYKIEVNSSTGTSNPVKFTDSMNMGLAAETQVKIEKNGTTIHTETLPKGSYGFNYTFDAMAPGDSYTITYKAKLNIGENQFVNQTASNTAHIESEKTDGGKISLDSKVETVFEQTYVSKKGVLQGDKILWTVKVNAGHHNIGGWKLEDVFNGADLTEGTFKVKKPNGTTEIVNKLPYTFPDNETGSYEFTYETPADKPIGGGEAWNNAKLTPPDGGNGPTSGDVHIGLGGTWNEYNPLNKQAESIIENADKTTATARWNVTVDAKDGPVFAPWTFKDELANDQYYTDQQIEELKAALNAALAGKPYAQYEFTPIVSNNKTTGYTLKFNKTMAKGDSFQFSYTSTAPLNGSNSQYFSNKVSINDKAFSQGGITYTPVVSKYDENNQSGGAETTHSASEEALNKDGTLKWGIVVTLPKDYNGGDLTVTEKLPEGVTLEKLTMCPEGLYNEQELHPTLNGNFGGNQVTVSGTETSTVTITIPEALCKNQGLQKIRFSVHAKINSDFPWPTDIATKVPFKNEVEVKDKDGKTIGTGTQTQKITQSEPPKVISKACDYDYNPWTNPVGDPNELSYSVTVNPNGEDLVKGSDILTLYDTIVVPKAGPHLNLDPTSVKVYELDESGNRIEPPLPADDVPYTLKYSTEGSDWTLEHHYRIRMILPDQKRLLVTYTYYAGDGAEYGNFNGSIKNIAELKGEGETIGEASKEDTVYTQNTGATADTDGLKIAKVKLGNYGVPLKGAKFTLSKYDRETGDYVPVTGWAGSDLKADANGYFTTNEQGIIIFPNLDRDTAYCLEEVIPPTGYMNAQNPLYYFWIPSGSSVTKPQYAPDRFVGTKYTGGEMVYIPNEPNTTEIRVSKRWFNSQAQDITSSQNGSIEFDLYRQEVFNKPTFGSTTGEAEIRWRVYYNGQVGSDYTLPNVPIGSKITLTASTTDKTANQWFEAYNDGSDSFLHLLMNDSEVVTVDGGKGSSNVHLQTTDSGAYFSYTFTLTDDVDILLRTKHASFNPFNSGTCSFTIDIEPPEATSASRAAGEVKKIGTYELSSNEGWSKVFKDLPKTGLNAEKQPVYYVYYVKEASTNSNKWDTSYINNGGIGGGAITIRNTQKKTTSLEINKDWKKDGELVTPAYSTVYFELLAYDAHDSESSAKPIDLKDYADQKAVVKVNASEYYIAVKADASGHGSVKLSGLPTGKKFKIREVGYAAKTSGYFVRLTDDFVVPWTVEYSADATAKGTITATNNMQETAKLKVEKKWIGATDDEKEPITVSLYQTWEGNTKPVRYKWINLPREGVEGDAAWSYTFQELPEMTNDGKKCYYYVVEAGSPEEFTVTYEPAGDTPSQSNSVTVDDSDDNNPKVITIKNTKVSDSTDISVTKQWFDTENQQINGNDTTLPTYVEVKLYTMDTNGQMVEVTTDKDGAPFGQKLLQPNDWTAAFTNLPKTDATGANIQYYVKEVGPITGFTVKYSNTPDTDEYGKVVDNAIVIRNTQEETEVVVEKKWLGLAENESAPSNVDVKLYKKVGTDIVPVTKDGNEVTETLTQDADGKWTAKFSNLPKYDSDGQLIQYYVKEITNLNGFVVSYTDEVNAGTMIGKVGKVNADGTATITNTKQIKFQVKKKWFGPDGTTDISSSINNKTIQVQLFAVRKDDLLPQALTEETFKLTLGTDGIWTAEFPEVPAVDEQGYEIKYYVKEVTNPATTGFTVSYGVEATFGDDVYGVVDPNTTGGITFTVKNTQEKTSVTATKKWKYANGSFEEDANSQKLPAQIEVQLYQQVNDEQIIPVTRPDNSNVTAFVEKEEGWTYTFDNLPKYNTNGELITYYVKETTAAADLNGFTLVTYSSQGALEDGTAIGKAAAATDTGTPAVTITNAEPTTGLTITKKWVNFMDDAARAAMVDKVYFKLQAYNKDEGETSAADVDWITLFDDLSKLSGIIEQVGSNYYIVMDFTQADGAKKTEATVNLTGLPADRNYKVVEMVMENGELVEVNDTNQKWTVTYESAAATETAGPTITVTNKEKASYQLPATGHPGGTRTLYTVGMLLLITAAVTLLYNRRKNRKEDYRFF